ncbi:TPA: CBS domain-containing protein, partial [Listeria monocytogenes]
LEELKVEDVMQTDFPVIKDFLNNERIVHLLVDNPFVCVIDKEFHFEGIVTRRVVLKQVNRYIHLQVEENR